MSSPEFPWRKQDYLKTCRAYLEENTGFRKALLAIANAKTSADSHHEQLVAILIAIAKTELQLQCCGDAACYNESNGVECAALKKTLTL